METDIGNLLSLIDDVHEFVGQIIDVFEDYLEKHKTINEPPDFSEFMDGYPSDYPVFISGNDYDELQTAIECVLKGWNLIRD